MKARLKWNINTTVLKRSPPKQEEYAVFVSYRDLKPFLKPDSLLNELIS
jgi:hypothetical protein